jgi:hypothetical protein
MYNVKLNENIFDLIKQFKEENKEIDEDEKQKKNIELLNEDIKIPKNTEEINSFFSNFKNFIETPENDIFINSESLDEINNNFNECKTISGKYLYYYFLKKADYNNVNLLKKDYNLLNNKENLKKAKDLLKNYLKNEKNIYKILLSLNPENVDMYSKLYLYFERLSILNKINDYPDILFTVNFYSLIFSPLLNVLSPLIFILGTIITVYLIFYRVKNHKYSEIINFIKMFFMTIKTKDFLNFIGFKKIIMFIISIIIYLYNYVSSNYYLFKNVQYHLKIYDYLYKNVDVSIKLINIVNDIIYSYGLIHPLFNKLKTNFKPPNIHCNSNKYLFFGESCVLFKKIYQNKEFIYNGMMVIGYLDLLITLNEQKEKYNLSFCKFNKNNEIKLIDCYHPLLLKNNSKIVKNNILINEKIKNICISGPNASGKSIILKTLIINLNYCYSFGFSFSKTSSIPKYNKIFILMNIHDTVGEESFYQAQVNQLNSLINIINYNPKNKYLCIMDEVLNSTNYYAATSIIYSLLEYLIEKNNLTTIFATHYFKVTELENLHKNIKNYHLMILENKDKTVKYCYKFIKGKCLVNNAFDILKKINFPDSIIENSINICNNLI